MTSRVKSLELRLPSSDYGLSARRLYEHTELGQINVFGQTLGERPELDDAAKFIDVIAFDGDVFSLLGFTLAQLRAGQIPLNLGRHDAATLRELCSTKEAGHVILAVFVHLQRCAIRQALRNQHQPFLPAARFEDAFGVPFIFSSLRRRLQDMGKSKAGPAQWLKTIENFQKSGMRAEEYGCSTLGRYLSPPDDVGQHCTAAELAQQCDFSALRLSVIPVVSQATQQLRFNGTTPERGLKRTKKLPKAQLGQTRKVAGFDPVLGYRIEQMEHQTLWGPEKHWQAVARDGVVLCDSSTKRTVFATRDAAMAVAALHAQQTFPKRLALGHFGNWSWTGGKDYREWLITLPYWPTTYLSGHFKVRNVLAHVRCDVRKGADGERVLMVQEVQSDWAQRARRASSTNTMTATDEVPPPFMKEWPALTMKLVLLHAAHQSLDAIAWTCGKQQVQRWSGLGAGGLMELYDRTLLREVNRIIKPLGGQCEELGVFVPTNFKVQQSENGYEVFSHEGRLLGTALTLEDAKAFVPDGGYESLVQVHGVRLPVSMRKAILDSGFPAWG